ncbi:MAG: hypothetical protein ACRD2A_22630 [Vicinamibacterales bacterium]
MMLDFKQLNEAQLLALAITAEEQDGAGWWIGAGSLGRRQTKANGSDAWGRLEARASIRE